MPQFEYTARTTEGTLRRGTMVARDTRELEAKLRTENLTLTGAQVGKQHSSTSFLERFQTVPMVQRMFFTQYLQVMIKSGFSIGRALDTLSKQTTSKYFSKIIQQIRQDVEAGMSFSKSLAKHPRVFSELYVNMVGAGEVSGKLDEVLTRLAMKMKKDHGLMSKVKGALTYPIIIIIVMIAIAIIMTVVVIPKLTEIFTESGAELPLATKVIVGLSQFLIKNGIWVAIGFMVLVAVFIRIVRTPSGKAIADGLILKTPIVGTIVRKISLARFTRSLSSLLETSIPIIETFSIISRTMGNTLYRRAVEDAGAQLKSGNAIAKVLERYPKLFPPLATQMIEVGEQSGSLDSIAGDLATFYEEEVDQTMSNLSTIIEPVLMLFLGVGVALMAISVILPIYKLSEQIG
ncbi:MAG: type II secretion system F family protein [Candidatus Kerfeldbacteria bacterium]|nr:type II secretion system F family protein [Candidatus Kerfeldbacteria bacterium]